MFPPDSPMQESYAQRLRLLHEIDRAILAAESTLDITRAAVRYIRQLVPSDRATLVLHHLEQEKVELMAVSGLGQDKFPESTISPLSDYPPLEPLLRGQPRYLPDLMQVLDLAPVVGRLVGMGLRCFVSLPLIAEDHLIGALTLSSTQTNAFTAEGIEIIQEVANLIAIALRQSQLREEIRRHTEELEMRVAERTAELTAANERLRELDDLKSKFVSDVSHELRTPISGLNIRLHLLERSQPQDYPRHIGLLKDQLAGLNKLVESILDLARLDLTDADKLMFAPVDLNAVVDEVSTAYEPLAQAAGLEFRFIPAANLPPIRGEHNQLSQVITNLVANAINYTAAGQISLKTWNENGQVYLAVRDTGMGIEAHEIPHIFTRFYRGERAGQSKVRGTGLGLGIVKEIVDLHGGSITVESARDQGSTFTMGFPIWRAEQN
ncbi:MAG: GAF domain-containing sensor histidine kinase [Anaerolineae bacterium]|nr:GAF domain-containing sensor histidine kinase [Anaerolineae bacterium]